MKRSSGEIRQAPAADAATLVERCQRRDAARTAVGATPAAARNVREKVNTRTAAAAAIASAETA